MITAVDSNILYDVLVEDLEFSVSSENLLQEQNRKGALIICPAVYAELLVNFLKKHEKKIAEEKLNEFLSDISIKVLPFTNDDFVLAAEAWGKFGKGREIECPRCGKTTIFSCPSCKRKIFWRNHILTDFLIGAYAQNNASCFLTPDKSYYKRYFKITVLP